MIQLTQKGKEIYGDKEVTFYTGKLSIRYEIKKSDYLTEFGSYVIASNPLELKALLDMGLIEIK